MDKLSGLAHKMTGKSSGSNNNSGAGQEDYVDKGELDASSHLR
jgi:hypothetical protein